ncbi:MAG: hypothetical protein ACRDZP_00735 [Acidimicrobiales bacterium]
MVTIVAASPEVPDWSCPDGTMEADPRAVVTGGTERVDERA